MKFFESSLSASLSKSLIVIKLWEFPFSSFNVNAYYIPGY
jgi:hypothetical protein